jgi:hypothetical protein
MSTMHDMAALVAGELERGDGVPCGACGCPHASSAADYEGSGKRCLCECCRPHWEEHFGAYFEERFPDLIERRRGGDVVTAAAVEEAIRRLKRSLAGSGARIAK